MKCSKILKYPEASMVKALQAVADGSSLRDAARRYGVPKTTLLYKFNGKYPPKRRMGPPTILTTMEEQQLATWVIHCADNGFPVTKLQLIDSVQLILKELQRETVFTNNRPGRAWFERFIERNQLRERMTQNLIKARASVTEGQLRNWFKEVEDHLKAKNALDILSHPTRIYNMDETAIYLTPKGDRVLVKKGTKAVYSFTHNDEKECLTTLLGSNADGAFVPPMVVFPYIRLPPRIAESAPKGWGIGKSESGWMTGELFLDYIKSVFHPWLVKNEIKLPIVLFIDGHQSHLTMALSTFCRAHDIILFSLFPNATHIYQPMDIGLFHTLKVDWKTAVNKFRMDNDGVKLQKEDFCKELLGVLKLVGSSVLRNSFRASGLYPFDADAIKYSSVIKNTLERTPPEEIVMSPITKENIDEYRQHLSFFEKFINNDTLSKFKSCGDVWNGAEEDKNLFTLWHNIFNMSVENNEHPHDQATVIATCDNSNDIIVNEDEYFENIFNEWPCHDEETGFYEPENKRTKNINHRTSTITIDASTSTIPSDIKTSTVLEIHNGISPIASATDTLDVSVSLNTSMVGKNEFLPEASLISTNKKKVNKRKVPSQLKEYFEYFQKKEDANELLNNEKLLRKQLRENKMKEKLSSTPAYSAISMERNSVVELSDKLDLNDGDCQMKSDEEISTVIETDKIPASATETVTSAVASDFTKETVTSTSTILNYDSSQSTQRNIPDNISIPFRKVLFFPKIRESTQKKNKPKVKPKVKPPSGITSDEWVEFFKKKEDEKKKLEEEKLLRKVERENKKKELEQSKLQMKELKQKQKLERDEKKKQQDEEKLQRKLVREGNKNTQQIRTSKKKLDLSLQNMNGFTVDAFVIVKYEQEYYPGVIKELKADMAYISVMVMANVDQWKWPRIPDIMWYNVANIVEIIAEPKGNERGFFLVAAMSKYYEDS